MRTMAWEEIDKDWVGLQKRHRMEIAQAVARYCVGHTMREVAERLGYGIDWVKTQLDLAGLSVGLGGEITHLTSSEASVSEQVPKLLSKFGPLVSTQVVGQGGCDIKVAGEDSAEFKAYLDRHLENGHEPAAAARLAKAEWAAEAAVEAGVITEHINKRNERVNQILFPTDAKETFKLDLKMHLARVQAASRFLDEAKMTFIREEATRSAVSKANEAWSEQVERVLADY